LSGLLAGKVWQSNLHPDLKPLAAALADIGNDDGTSIYPSVAYMSWLLGRSTRSVQGNLAKLRGLGVLAIVSDLKGGRYKTTEYRLIESALPAREKWKRNHAIGAGFRKRGRGAGSSQKQRSLRPKPRSLQRETTNSSSPEPLVEPSGRTVREAEAAASTASAEQIARAFEAMDCKPFGDPNFQLAWALAYSEAAALQTNPVWSEVMEAAIARCGELGVKVPRQFFLHKREIEALEVKARYRRTPL
jgi:hypothetical protein